MMANMMCIHADSGDGKTSLIGSFIQYVYETYGKKSRLVTADNYDVLQPHIAAGILDVWEVALWDHPFEVINYACRGYWPQDPADPTSKILPATAATYQTYKLQCFEGLSHFSDMLMKRLADVGGAGQYIGPGTRVNTAKGEADLISFKDGEYGVGGNSMTHYGLVQKEMRANVLATSALPIQCIWSAHTVKASEDNKPIYGPQLAGLKATAKVQSWFSSLLHCHKEFVKDQPVYKIYLKDHIDKASGPIPYKALQRVPLPLLDTARQETVMQKWNEIIPDCLDWTNDSRAAFKYMDIRKKMLEAAKDLILIGGPAPQEQG
jgi:hypothetical protein